MKNLALPLVFLFVGGAAGYGVRALSEGGARKPLLTEIRGAANQTADASPSARPSGAVNGSVVADTASTRAAITSVPLADQMKELLVDCDLKSARKAAAKLSAGDLQAALALVAAMPKSTERDALRAQLYRAWTALNPNAAWNAALDDPLDMESGYLVGSIAAELAKTNPTAAIDLAQSLDMGARRTTVVNAVFREWSTVDVTAAVAYTNAHPDLPVDFYVFQQGLAKLAESRPLQAANLITTLKDERTRDGSFQSLMRSWMAIDSGAALHWAESISNPTMTHEAVAAAIGAWAKSDPNAALNYARSSPDPETRTAALQDAWKNWFRKSPAAATAYLASSGDAMLLENVSASFSYLFDGFTTKERTALMAQFPEGTAKQRIYSTVVDTQIRKGQFNQALELLNTLPDSTTRDRNVAQLGEQWAKSDLKAATAWLKLQPDSTDRDLAVAGYAATLARTDPMGALEWTNSIPDPTLRQSAMKNIGVRWLKADAAKAEAWMSGVREFSESDKRFIRSMAAIRGDFLPSSVTVGTRR